MVLRHFAEIDGQGVCFALLSTTGEVVSPTMIEVAEGENRLRQKWNGTDWEAVVPSEAETAAAALALIDAQTGMSRSMREALIAIGGKVAANVTYLQTKEAEAATLRTKLK